MREQVFVADKAILTVEYEAGSLSLRVVDAYKHLGGIVASSGSQCRELQARVKAMNSGVAALNRLVLSKHEVRLEDKLQRGHSFCSFTLARGRDWALLSSKRCTVRACTFSDVPPTCTEAGSENATDREVLVATGCYTIDVQVAMLRLLFFARLVQWRTAPLCCVAGLRWEHHFVDYGVASGSRLAQQDGGTRRILRPT